MPDGKFDMSRLWDIAFGVAILAVVIYSI